MTPSSCPTAMPTTLQPSAPPTISGFVSTIIATTSVSEEFDENTIDEYVANIADIYGMETSDITPEIVYTASGSMTMTIPDGIPAFDVENAVAISIAESLGIHPQAIEVTVDLETGEVQFTVTTDSFEEAADVQFNLENAERSESIIEAIGNTIPSVTVEELNVSDTIDATIEFVVDSDNAANDLTQAAYQSEQLFSDNEFDVTVESNFMHVFETFQKK